MAEKARMIEDQRESLSEQERALIAALSRTGSATSLELAVRTFRLPEEIAADLHTLQEKELIEVQRFPNRLGLELLSLTEKGLRLVRG